MLYVNNLESPNLEAIFLNQQVFSLLVGISLTYINVFFDFMFFVLIPCQVYFQDDDLMIFFNLAVRLCYC